MLRQDVHNLVKRTSLDKVLRAATILDMDKNIHAIQGNILKLLLLRETARFSELNAKKIGTDQLTFHIKQLLESGIVEKTSDGSYRLTTQGKEYANRFDVDSGPVKMERQAKLAVLVIATRRNGKQREYLMQTRRKQPFFGFRGFITGKIKWGESVADAAARELLEETGLHGTLENKAIQHELIYLKDSNELVEDKYFYIFRVQEPEGKLADDFESGTNEWISEDQALAGNIFYEIEDLMKLAKAKQFAFTERTYHVERY